MTLPVKTRGLQGALTEDTWVKGQATLIGVDMSRETRGLTWAARPFIPKGREETRSSASKMQAQRQPVLQVSPAFHHYLEKERLHLACWFKA